MKSEQQLRRAKQLYEAQGDRAGVAKASRLLAIVLENMNKLSEAVTNYDQARQTNIAIQNKPAATLNENDIKRLQNKNGIAEDQEKINANIEIGKNTKDTFEIVRGYSKIGTLNEWKSDTTSVEAYKQAYEYSKTDPDQARKYNQILTEAYLKNNDFKNAIATKKDVLAREFVKASPALTARETIELADIYVKQEDDSTAIRLLQTSFALATSHGYTLEAIKAVSRLDSIYVRLGQDSRSAILHRQLVASLPTVIAKDSSLVEGKLVSETEARLKLLENEKLYKDELIARKNLLNSVLSFSLAAMAISLTIILITVRNLRRRNKKIALQSLRREMNPHFIFNSLNSVNQFIANNNELAANQYLTKFSTLMRTVIEDSKDDFIPFVNEMAFLRNYLELEKSRFPSKFNFEIDVHQELLTAKELFIPGMLIQPQLENAIWHGLRYQEGNGLLRLNIYRNADRINVIIEDNGIGIAASKLAKTANQRASAGRGMNNTAERIRLLNHLYGHKVDMHIEDKPATNPGVRVTITLPLLKKKPA